MNRKAVLWSAVALVLVLGAGIVLWRTGALPFLAGSSVAVADTTAAARRPGPGGGQGQGQGREGGAGHPGGAGRGGCPRHRRLLPRRQRGGGRPPGGPGGPHRGPRPHPGRGGGRLGGEGAGPGRVGERPRADPAAQGRPRPCSDKSRQLERSRQMLDEQLISRQEYDDQDSACKLAEAERDLARIALEDTRIRAPFAGRITERRIVPGPAGQPGRVGLHPGGLHAPAGARPPARGRGPQGQRRPAGAGGARGVGPSRSRPSSNGWPRWWIRPPAPCA